MRHRQNTLCSICIAQCYVNMPQSIENCMYLNRKDTKIFSVFFTEFFVYICSFELHASNTRYIGYIFAVSCEIQSDYRQAQLNDKMCVRC